LTIERFYESLSAATLRRAVPRAADEEVAAAARESAGLIAAMPFPTRSAMWAAASLLSARAALGDRAPLDAVPEERRDEWMDRWAGATVPPLRQLAGGVRAIALTALYAQAPNR